MKQIFIVLSVGVILLAGCTPGLQNKLSENNHEAVKVKVMEIGMNAGNDSQSYIATIEESVLIPISFLSAGTADKVMVGEGQRVSKGQLLAELNREYF